MANKILNIGIALLFSLTIYAQDYKKVDATVKAYPHSFRTLDKLASRIDTDFTREDEKARAIFTWIATNISYDLDVLGTTKKRSGFSYSSEAELIAKQKQFQEDMAYTTLRSKKGVCQGYATLYAVIAEKVGLEAEVIPGTAKSYRAHIGKYPKVSDHAWNAVKINNEWRLVDVTWGAGGVIADTQKFEFDFSDSYFFSDPKYFFLKHYPEDEKWLLLNASKEEFAALPLYYRNYLKEGYEIITPTMGVLTISKREILFKIKGLKPTDRINYVFTKSNVFKEIQPIFNNDVAEFFIPLDRNSIGFLIIYINEEAVVSYKIDRG